MDKQPEIQNDTEHAIDDTGDMPKPEDYVQTSKTKRVIAAVVGLLALGFGGLTAFVYTQSPTNNTVRQVATHVPYPAAVVDDELVSIKEYLNERDALLKFYQAAGQKLPEEQKNSIGKDVMKTLVNKVAVEQLAQKYGVTLDKKRVDEFSKQVMGQNIDRETFEKELKNNFGWSKEQFEKRIVHSVVLASQMSEHIAQNEEFQKQRREKAENALKRVEDGEAFNDVAKDVSKDFEMVQGGDVGSVKLAQIPEAWRESVTSLEVGEHTDVIDGQGAYLVLKLTDKMDAGEDSEVRLSVIAVPKRTLNDVVDEYLNGVRVLRLI